MVLRCVLPDTISLLTVDRWTTCVGGSQESWVPLTKSLDDRNNQWVWSALGIQYSPTDQSIYNVHRESDGRFGKYIGYNLG